MLALDPKYKLKKTRSNILFYRFDDIQMDLVDQFALHPNTAILLSFLNGANDLEQVKKNAEYIFGLQGEQLEKVFDNFMATWQPYLIETDKCIRHDNPSGFVMPSIEIDIKQIKCLFPLYMGILVTQRCYRECIYCYSEKEENRILGEMNYSQIESIIMQSIDLGIEYLLVSGGDPFVRKDVLKILEVVLAAKIPIQLSTKQFLDNATINHLKKLGLKNIQVSIDAIDDNLNKVMIGVSNYAERIIKTISELQTAGIITTTNSVVTGLNIDHIPELLETLKKLNIPLIRLSQYHRTAYRHKDILFVPEHKIRKLNDLVQRMNSQDSSGFIQFSAFISDTDKSFEEKMDDFINRPHCSAGRLSMLITSGGMAIPCEQLPCTSEFILGDATKDSIIDIWNSQKTMKFTSPSRTDFKNSMCSYCDYFILCIINRGACYRDAWKNGNDAFSTSPWCPKLPPDDRRRMY